MHVKEPVLNKECLTGARAGTADDVLCLRRRTEVDEVRTEHLSVNTHERALSVIHTLGDWQNLSKRLSAVNLGRNVLVVSSPPVRHDKS